MKAGYRVIIFDFDGVITESVRIKTKAFGAIYEKYGDDIVKRVEKHHIENGGMSRYDKFNYYHRKYLKTDLNDDQIDELSNKFSSLVVEKVIDAPYINGSMEFIEKYYRVCELYIVSATPQFEIDIIVKRRRINKYFNKVLGSPSSKDYNIKKIIENNHYDLNEVCYIGDSINDYMACKNVGIKFIGLCINLNNPFPSSVKCVDSYNNISKLI